MAEFSSYFRGAPASFSSGAQAGEEREVVMEGLLSALPDVLYVLDPDGYLQDWNGHLLEVTGYTDEEIAQMHLLDLVPLRYQERLGSLRRKIFKGAESVTVEAAVLTKEGIEIPHEFSSAGIRDEEGQVVVFVGVGRDISDRTLLEQEKLEVSRQERLWFAGELHDGTCQQLSTLSVLLATLELHLGEVTGKVLCLLGKIRALLDRTIQQTRALSHGIVPINFEEVGLDEALVELTAETSEAYEIDCTFSNDSGVSVDNPETATNLYRIVQEALRNALRHGKAGQVCIALCQENEDVTVSIADNGIGICEKLISQKEQSGLGLKTMRYRARIMSGALDVRRASEEGGTVVQCTIPAHATLRHT